MDIIEFARIIEMTRKTIRPGVLVAPLALSVFFAASCGLEKKIDETLNPPKDSTKPVAIIAEPTQTVKLAATVTLDAKHSYDPRGQQLTYAWSLDAKPNGSAAALTSATAAITSFVADKGGYYTASLQVTNESAEVSEIVTTVVDVVGTGSNHPPVSYVGADLTATVGDTVVLDGTGSFDADGDTLNYTWVVQGAPSGSTAAINGASDPKAFFPVDAAGTYTISLIISDGVDQDVDILIITVSAS